MLDSDIRNITTNCQERMQPEETNAGHGPDCTCETCCCDSSQSNCQDNGDQCEPSPGMMKQMNDKRLPTLASYALILAIIGITGGINRINAIERISAHNIDLAHGQIITAQIAHHIAR